MAFRQQIVDLVRAGRTSAELANEFEPTAQPIVTWIDRNLGASKNMENGTTLGAGKLREWTLYAGAFTK